MCTVWLFLALLGCVCCTDYRYVFSHSKLQNVAYSKQVTLSSQHSSNKFPGSNAVNGILSDFAHTSPERYPWLKINLGARYRIHEIEIFARSGCCGSQLHDLDVTVGDSIHDMELCGHFTGPANTGQRIAIWCPHNTVGRYVQVQIVSGTENRMSPAEILVWGVHVH